MPPLKQTTALAIQQDPRWQALRTRDGQSDGTFWYSVASTGVYCRPSCAARTPRPENVAFHTSQAAAQKAGFRACKRCRPDGPDLATEHAALVAELCRFIAQAERTPTLQELAQRASLSPSHLQRLFKSVTGLSPRDYAAAQRGQRVRHELHARAGITQALYGAGYGSSGRFYAEANALLGMTPSDYRAGAPGHAIRFAVGACTLGSILVAATERGVCAILLGDEPEGLLRELEQLFPRAELVGGDAAFEALVAQVVGFVEAPRLGLGLPLDVRGSAFQHRVWQALCAIPAGETASYADVARAIGAPKAVRAVARACASNALALAIPCHRVVRTGGGLSGYRWGVERKRALLAREARS